MKMLDHKNRTWLINVMWRNGGPITIFQTLDKSAKFTVGAKITSERSANYVLAGFIAGERQK